MKGQYQTLAFGFKHWKNQTSNNQYRSINLHKNYYSILQVHHTDSPENIKKSYLKLARQLHPDFNPSGHNRFTQVQEAYNILSNKQFRQYYNLNSQFVTPFKAAKQKKEDPLNYRNKKFYDDFQRKGFDDFQNQWQKETNGRSEYQRKEESEQQKQRRKIEDQINLTKSILFSHNPVWSKANAFMNYEERNERQMKKQKQVQELFPKTSKSLNKIISWMSKF